ncbi:hypothetical protein KQX54_004608, partial [Cotesia glomerata]
MTVGSGYAKKLILQKKFEYSFYDLVAFSYTVLESRSHQLNSLVKVSGVAEGKLCWYVVEGELKSKVEGEQGGNGPMYKEWSPLKSQPHAPAFPTLNFYSKDFALADSTNSNKPPKEQSLENLTQSLSDLCKADFIEGPKPEQQPEQQQFEQQELGQQQQQKPELHQQPGEPLIIPIASTSTGTPSLRPLSRYFRSRIIDESSDEELEKSLTKNIIQTAASSKAK